MSDWHIFTGENKPHDGIGRLPDPPPWRDFANPKRNAAFCADERQVEMVNAALYLRRPLLVTGKPGSGKSTLAGAVAAELGLGEVLRWNINSRTTLDDGLYSYDAIGRLRETAPARPRRSGRPKRSSGSGRSVRSTRSASATDKDGSGDDRIGEYLRLGPLGTALALSKPKHPRVVLIDEIDKSDIDLPNDLLHVLEEGEFEIPELKRIASRMPTVKVLTADRRKDVWVPISNGKVQGGGFPFVLLTSNGERELPPAFFRRCLRLDLPDPDENRLEKIVAAHLGTIDDALLKRLIKKFVGKQATGVLAIDQLLNALFLIERGRLPDDGERERLEGVLLRELEGD